MGSKYLMSLAGGLRTILASPLFFSTSFTLLFVGLYATVSTVYANKRQRTKYVQQCVDAHRDNCVVTYSKGSMKGWPPYTSPIEGLKNIRLLFEPVTHFIDKAQVSLDVAAMIFNVNIYMDAVKRAKERGVNVRFITHFEKTPMVLNLLEISDDIQLYVPDEDLSSSLLHYKYMVRDVGTDNECVCFGSMNFTISGATDNFENLVFTQIGAIVSSAHENFLHCIDYLHEDRQKYYKKVLLKQVGIM